MRATMSKIVSHRLHNEEVLDQALASTFPASDPVSFTATSIAAADMPELDVTKAAMKKTTKKPAAKKAKGYALYAASGGGSMIVEAAFGFAKRPIEVVDVPWEDTGWNSKTLKALNPLGQ